MSFSVYLSRLDLFGQLGKDFLVPAATDFHVADPGSSSHVNKCIQGMGDRL